MDSGTAYRYAKDSVGHTHAQSVWQPVDVIYEYEVQAATHLEDFNNRISVWIPGDIETNEASEFPHMQKKKRM